MIAVLYALLFAASGGIQLTMTGRNLDVVQRPVMNITLVVKSQPNVTIVTTYKAVRGPSMYNHGAAGKRHCLYHIAPVRLFQVVIDSLL